MRNSANISTKIFHLRDSFGNYVSENFKMANSLNYIFSRLGDFFCKANTLAATNSKNSFNSLHLVRAQNQFQFRFITESELKKLKALSSQNQWLLSSIPPWALKDGYDVLIGHLTNVINSFISGKKFPNNLKTAFVTPL